MRKLVEERIFALLKTEDMANDFIDLHGPKVAEGIEIAVDHLKRWL